MKKQLFSTEVSYLFVPLYPMSILECFHVPLKIKEQNLIDYINHILFYLGICMCRLCRDLTVNTISKLNSAHL